MGIPTTTRERAYCKFDALISVVCRLELSEREVIENVIHFLQDGKAGVFEDCWDNERLDAAQAVMWGGIVAYLKALIAELDE